MISAEALRELANELEAGGDEGSKAYSLVVDEILSSVLCDGEESCRASTGGNHMEEDELAELRGLGYRVQWNSPCLWYRVSWEK